jgi:hypothetical protein
MKCHVFTPNLMHRYGANDIGDEVEVPDAIAKDLIEQGIAREAKGKASKPQTQTPPPPKENATAPGGSKRGGKGNVEKPKG